jgi:hypothetical protein
MVVREHQYHWRALGTVSGIEVVVITPAAFDRGKAAQQLRFALD